MTERVALAHDWLTGMRGGEKVLERIAILYPHAPIHTLLHVEGSINALLESHPIRTSFIQRLPRSAELYRWYLPLFPLAISRFDLSGYELIVSSSHCAAKAVIPGPGTVHICYCHTPMRYAWDQFDAYFSRQRYDAIRFTVISAIMRWLRRWDRATAGRVHAFAANSAYVAERIRRYYGRSSTVIPPPVDIERFTPGNAPPAPYHLMVSALTPYKRLEIAIEAFNRLRRRLIIVGDGPEYDRLAELAGPEVQLVGRVDDDNLLELYQRCEAFVLPGLEDAGIAPIEAMACGRPALVLGEGGAAESVVDGLTGIHITAPVPEAIIEAVDRSDQVNFNTGRIRAHALQYSPDAFSRRFLNLVRRCRSAVGATDQQRHIDQAPDESQPNVEEPLL